MTEVGELVVNIKANATQLNAEMSRATATVRQSGEQMTAAMAQVKEAVNALVPAFSAVALIEFGKSAIESAENITHMADRIGFSVQTLSALEPTLKKNGSSVDQFAASVNFLNRNLGLAASGNAPQLIQKFDTLGLSVTKLMAMNPEQRFFAVASALGQQKDQANLAADAFLLMGRSVAGLLSTIKETGGNFDEVIKKAQALGQVITPEQEKQVRAFEAAWVDMVAQMKIAMLNAMPVLNLYLAGIKAIITLPDEAEKAGEAIGNIMRGNARVSTMRPKTVTEATHDPKAIDEALKARGLPGLDNPAAGSNKDLAGQAKYQVNEVQTYIKTLKDEADALGLSKLRLEEVKAEREAASKAITDYNNGLRKSKELTTDELKSIDESVAAYDSRKVALEKIHKQEEEELHMQAQLKAEISSALAQGIMDYKNFGSTVKNVLGQITKQIIEMQVTTPLVKSIGGAFGGNLFGSLFGGGGANNVVYQGFGDNAVGLFQGFADGGSPPVGVPSVVGENGPELFVPHTAGTIVPNSKLGGGSVTVQNTFIMQPGLSETVNAAVMRSAPTIIQASHDSVIAALQKGGSDSRVARLRA